MNEKAKSYVVTFANGDVKLFDAKHTELAKIKGLH